MFLCEKAQRDRDNTREFVLGQSGCLEAVSLAPPVMHLSMPSRSCVMSLRWGFWSYVIKNGRTFDHLHSPPGGDFYKLLCPGGGEFQFFFFLKKMSKTPTHARPPFPFGLNIYRCVMYVGELAVRIFTWQFSTNTSIKTVTCNQCLLAHF